MKTLLNMFAAPSEALEVIQSQPTWRSAFAAITIGLFVITWLGGCWRDLSQAFGWANLIGPALASFLVVGLVSLGSTALLCVVFVWPGNPNRAMSRFKTLYSVNIHSAAICLLGEVVNFLLVRTPALEQFSTPLRGRFPVGLDLILLGAEDPNAYLSVVLHATSVFIVWYLCVLALGIRTVTGISAKRAAAIVIALWCVMVAFALGGVYVAGGSTTISIRM